MFSFCSQLLCSELTLWSVSMNVHNLPYRSQSVISFAMRLLISLCGRQSSGASTFNAGGLFGGSKPFGSSSPSLFGQSTGGSLFGNTGSTLSFQTGGLMGLGQSQAGNTFSFNQPNQLGGQQNQQNLTQLPGQAPFFHLD